jgi:hypothetical protein
MNGPRARTRFLVSVTALAVAGLAVTAPASATVEPPPGAATPTPGSGIGTSAALNNPKCVHDDPRDGVYGRFSSTTVGGGPVCVRPWKEGADNGGVTAPGVTKDAIEVFAVVPNEEQINSPGGTAPTNRTTSSRGTYQDAVHDYLLPLMKYYETWGRDIDVRFLVSSGNDEAAQRADAVTIKAERPFAVVNFVPAGSDFLDAELAKSKILVFGYATNAEKALAQAPYRWGLTDTQAAAVNASVVIGKQLGGKPAEFAGGSDVQRQTRKFGTVYIDGSIDVDRLTSDLGKHRVTLATQNSYTATGAPRGDATTAQEQAPTIATKMKEAGVTTVILFTDVAMTKALMENATRQEWYPEWFFTGTLFHDLALLARDYPPDQAAHAFGISVVSPWVLPDPPPASPQKSLTVLTNPLNWYWGETAATSASATPQHLTWLMTGIHAAGPRLTPKTFQQGLFSIPASGGAADGAPTGSLMGYGKNAGLPYDEYLGAVGIDFAPVWWDPETSGPSQGTGSEGTGVAWYPGGAKRYTSKTVPKRQFGWFDKSGSVFKFDYRPTPAPEYAGDCTGCPSQGGPGQPGTPDPAGFVAKAYGGGDAPLS